MPRVRRDELETLDAIRENEYGHHDDESSGEGYDGEYGDSVESDDDDYWEARAYDYDDDFYDAYDPYDREYDY